MTEPETTTPPELKPDDLVQFVEHHRPKLEAGDYRVSVTQSLQIDEASTEALFSSEELDFTVQGERLSLGEENFHAVFPPPGSRGKFGHILPHVILNRSTLPWERSPLGGTEEDPDSPSWLALLVFGEDEAMQISAQVVTADQLQPNPAGSPATAAATPYFQQDFTLESGQHASDRVSVIDVPWALLKTLLPHYHDLRVTAHVRRVGRNTGPSGAAGGLVVLPAAPADQPDKPAAGAPADPWAPIGPELALIMANRLPPSDQTCLVHLVSLEERFQYPDNLTGPLDPCLVRSPVAVGNNTLAGWLQKLKPQETLKLVAGNPPQVIDTNSSLRSLDSTALGALQVKEMGESMLGDEKSVWRTQLEELGEVKFTAPFAWNNASLGHIEVTIFQKGWDSVALSAEQVRQLADQVPPIAGFAGNGMDLKFLGLSSNPLGLAETRRLADWIEFQAREQLLAEQRTALSGWIKEIAWPQTTAGDNSLSLAALLQGRRQLLTQIQNLDKAKLSPEQQQKRNKLEARFREMPLITFSTPGFDLRITLESLTAGVTATVARGVKLQAGQFCLLKPEPVFAAQGAEGTGKIRLVSLKHWTFTCEAEKGGFVEELSGLNSAHTQVAEFHVPLPGQLAENAAAAHQAAWQEGRRYLRSGAVALRHGLRGGDHTFSWYHGPFISNARAQARLSLPARAPDELLIFNEALGMFDVSYAAAWELGRLTVLEDNNFAMALFHWKRDHSRTLAHLRQKVDIDFLPLVRPTPDLDLPDSLAGYFRSLTLLEDIPFNYLVPDEQLLPPESIRFFTVDSMWLECLRDGAFSVGRVLARDHLEDTAHRENLERPPRLSGFLIRANVVSDWPQLLVEGYAGVDRDDAALENQPNPAYPKLTLERFDRLGPNVLLCLFSDPDRSGREIEMADIHLPAEVLHFGLEENDSGKLMKQLRDPNTGEALSQWSWLNGGEPAEKARHGYRIDRVVLESLKIAGVDPNVQDKLKAIENKGFEATAADFVEKHLMGHSPDGAGLTAEQLDTQIGDSGETVRQLILSSAGPFRISNQTIERIPFRSNGALNVIDLSALYQEVANWLAPVLPASHRFTAADFSFQMLDTPPLVRFVRPARLEVN